MALGSTIPTQEQITVIPSQTIITIIRDHKTILQKTLEARSRQIMVQIILDRPTQAVIIHVLATPEQQNPAPAMDK